jgi:hypothetical protein
MFVLSNNSETATNEKEENMKARRNWMKATGILLSVFIALTCYAAYSHHGEIDSPNFVSVYPQAAGTKLDSCTLCHRGGTVTSGSPPKTTTYGSCQWCHYTYGYNAPHGNILDTLNQYGLDYLSHGRDSNAIQAIENLDSDGDGYPNKVEIAALRYPGDASDDPTKVAAPSKVFTQAQLEAMPQHTQFLLMNASKSTDTYTQYTGVPMEDLLKPLVLPSAIDVMVLSPDGFSQTHPFQYNSNPSLYNVYGTYPAATFYYNAQADVAPAQNPSTGWCDYSAPSTAGRANGDPIVNSAGLKMILAIKRDGQYLDPGVLDITNKLNGEGPYRVVPPQKVPGPPDQRSTATQATNPAVWVWPYFANGDHNAGSSARSVTIMKVEPLPQGTTDINLLEAGWDYIDEAKIVVYGAIDPLDNINEKLAQVVATVNSIPQTSFKRPWGKWTLKTQLQVIQSMIAKGDYAWAYYNLQQNVLGNIHGCPNSSYPNDWLKDCNSQTSVYWAVYEIAVLLKILT